MLLLFQFIKFLGFIEFVEFVEFIELEAGRPGGWEAGAPGCQLVAHSS
jgi:hypothetical protein